MNYTFPPTRFVSEKHLAEQYAHVLSEIGEVLCAKTGRDRLTEILDHYHSIETYLRMHSPEYVEELVAIVERKNRERGYYEEG